MRIAGTATLLAACAAVLALLGSAGTMTKARSIAPDRLARLAGSADMVAQAGGSTQVIRMDGDIAWMGTGPRVVAVDVSDPSAPRTLGRSDLMPGLVVDLAIPSLEPNGAGARTDMAWALVAGSAGTWLVSVDISRSWSPTYVGAVQVAGRPLFFLAAIDDHLWLVKRDGSVMAIDARDPSAPSLVSSTPLVDPDGPVRALGAIDGHLVLATYADPASRGPVLYVVDVGDPSAPVVVGTLPHPGTESWSVRDMTVAGGLVWIYGYSELWAVDVTDPALPVVVGKHRDDNIWGYHLAVADGKAFLVGGDWGHNWVTVAVIDVSDPTAMVTLADRHHVQSLKTNPSGGLAVRDGVLWMGVDDGRVMSVDASDPSAEPDEAGAVPNPGPIGEIAHVGHYLLGSLPEAVAVIDVREAAAPRQITQTLAHRYPESISVDGDLAVVSVGGEMDVLYSAIETVDVGDPRRPDELGELMTKGEGRADVSGGNALVCEGAWSDDPGTLGVVDVTDPRAPTRLGELKLGDGCNDVVLRDDTAYALAPDWRWEDEFRLHVVDASDPSQPSELGSLRLDGPPERWRGAGRLTLGESHVHVVTGGTSTEPDRRVPPKLHVVDVSDAAAPSRVALFDLPSIANAVAYDDGYLFLAMHGGVKIMNVRDPANPRDVITLPVEPAAEDVEVADGLVYVAAGSAGIYIYAPHLPGWEPWVATPTATATDGPSPTPTLPRSTPTRRTPTPYPLTLTPDLMTPTVTPDPQPIRIYSPFAATAR